MVKLSYWFLHCFVTQSTLYIGPKQHVSVSNLSATIISFTFDSANCVISLMLSEYVHTAVQNIPTVYSKYYSRKQICGQMCVQYLLTI